MPKVYLISHTEVDLPVKLEEMGLVDIRGVSKDILDCMFAPHTNNVKQDYLLCYKNKFYTLMQGKDHSDEFAYYRVSIENA